LASLSSDCCDSPMQLIAFDIDADFTVVPWLKRDGITSLQDDEIILGTNITKEIGDKVKYFGREFKVVNLLEETGMGYDNSAFISYEAAFQIAKDPVYQRVLPFRSDTKVISMILLDIAEGYTLDKVKNNIEKKYGDKEIAIYSTNQLLTKFSDSLKNINTYGTLIKVLFILLATASLYAIFSITIYLRRHEFGSMLSVGVSRRKIIKILIWEMFYVVVIASIVGILIVCGIIFPFHMQIKSLFTIPYLLPSSGMIVSMSFKMFAINVLVCIAASFQLFWKFSKMEAQELIKEENG
jgi:putative ABC transport system permease protein